MKVTSSQANKILRKLSEQYSSLTWNENESSTFQAAVGEDPETVRPEYDYAQTQKQLNDLEKQIRALKHKINCFNATTRIEEFDMTIDEMLVYIPQLTKRRDKLARMKNTLPKKRCESYNKNIIDYKYINYSLDEVKSDYEAVADELSRAQIALDTVNNSVEFELDD
ncbi:MAG: hypothetical protein II712_05315 [Erysipelotrichaceae bacterium]|nr:hypothetical protein [Erysipelotrichaceae bacterium]